MGRIKKLDGFLGTRVKKVDENEFKVFASKIGIDYSELLREIIICFIKTTTCRIRRKYDL